MKYEYKPICKQNQLIFGTGTTAIITGWTPKEKIAKHLEPHQYAVIGQLYNPVRGISPLIRNLLANPHVDAVCLLSATKEDENAKGICCLRDFFEYGFGDDGCGSKWTIESSVEGYIDKDIAESDLEQLIEAVGWNYFTDRKELIDKVKADELYFGDGDRDAIIYPEPKRENNSLLPGVLCGQRIEADTVSEAWIKLLQRIRTNGIIRPTGYDGSWQELIDLVVVVKNEPKLYDIPDYLPCTQQSVLDYLPQMCENKGYRDGVKYTYGQRIFTWFGKNQFEQVRDKLIKEIDSASGVICLWDSGSGNNKSFSPLSGYNNSVIRANRHSGDSDHDHSGSPCLNHIWFRVLEGRLIMSALFRSNDMFNAWPFNAFGLRSLQRNMRDSIALHSNQNIDLAMGELITISQSAHIYEDCYEYADKVVVEQYKKILVEERKLYENSPCGNFIVAWDGEKQQILVNQVGSKGQFKRYYVGTDSFRLTREIIDCNPSIMPDHAAYLGYEITKCFYHKEEYFQDR